MWAFPIMTKRLRLELHGFHYKVPLHLSYLHIKFDDVILRDFIRIVSQIKTKSHIVKDSNI